MNTIDDVLSQQSLKRLQKYYAENNTGRGVVFFVGSGLSAEAGLPNWRSLAELLSAECKKLTETNSFSQSRLGHLYANLERESDIWSKFSYIKEILGQSTFSSAVKDILSTDRREIPEPYSLLCDLKLQGIVSLNIDDFMVRSMHNKIKDQVYPVYGNDDYGRLSELTRMKPFLYQPHGSITSENSWVFTKEDFDKLCDSPVHDNFLTSLFLRDTVIFIGISADDVGASLRLAKLREQKLRPEGHFWITTTSHLEKREWAENSGIQQILYPASLGHARCIKEILKSLSSASSSDEKIITPITGFDGTDEQQPSIPSPSQLFKLDDIDEIRITLNRIIRSRSIDGEISYQDYSDICRSYARAIHSCYMMPTGDSGENWFGYRITGKPLGGKTVGRIMPAVDSSGRSVAIKILDQRRYTDEMYLSAFRRGIKALKILSKRGVDGAVEIYDAYEVPPTIVMRFLNCASLEDAVLSKKISPLKTLRAMRDATATILAAHLLPETVLHRDIRPSNLLLEDFDWDDGSYSNVKVIDFDLAWHKGAIGDDFVRSDRDSLGYQAPEQLTRGDNYLRRSTSIDSFGIGATLFFCISETVPDIGAQKDLKWEQNITRYAHLRFRDNPEIVKFVSDTIFVSMSANSDDRFSVSEIKDRLDDAIRWIENDIYSCSLDFLSEMICSMSCISSYETDVRRKTFLFHSSSGLYTEIKHDFLDGELEVSFLYSKPKNVDNGRADKILNRLKDHFGEHFADIGKTRVSFNFTGTRQFAARASIKFDAVKKNPRRVAECVRSVVQELNIQ